MITRSKSEVEPNDWVEYVNAKTGEVVHIDEFHNPQRTTKRPGCPDQPTPKEPE